MSDAKGQGSLETAVALIDDAITLAGTAIDCVNGEAYTKEMNGKLSELRARRAALEPRLARRRENQAKLPPRDAEDDKRTQLVADERHRKYGSDT